MHTVTYIACSLYGVCFVVLVNTYKVSRILGKQAVAGIYHPAQTVGLGSLAGVASGNVDFVGYFTGLEIK